MDWLDGKKTDFYGNPRAPECRDSFGGQEYVWDEKLPVEGWAAGMTLSRFETESADPVCLFDRWGKIIYQWKEGYLPDREEIRQKVLEILRKEGRRVG